MALGFGVIGCGMISGFHARAIAEVRGAKLVGGFDAEPAAADKFAANFGCNAYRRLKDMLADPEIEVVTIGTPSGAHLQPAVAARSPASMSSWRSPWKSRLAAATR